MPKVSSAQKDAFHFKGGYEDGWGEVVDAKALMFQFPPTKETKGNRPAGSQDPPALYLSMSIQRYADKNTKLGTPPEEVLLPIARPDKAGNPLPIHPGNYPDGDLSKDVVDCGDGLGAEGNTVFAVQDGYAFNDKVKYMLFCKSLEEKGFKPAVLEATYFPSLIGMIANFKTELGKKFRDDMDDPKVFVVTEIAKFPYEGKQTKSVSKAVFKTVPTQQVNGAPVPKATVETAEASAEADESGAEGIALAILAQTAKKYSGQTMPDIKKLKVAVITEINNYKPAVQPDDRKQVQEFFKNNEWLQESGVLEGIDFQADGSIAIG
jgi:hypothetical protein